MVRVHPGQPVGRRAAFRSRSRVPVPSPAKKKLGNLQLPFDLTLEDLEDPGLVSRPRNRLIAQAFYDMHIIEHYGSGMRRMKKDCDENGSPYPAMKSGSGEFRITFSARTKESVAKLGIPPEKFGIRQNGEIAANVGVAESAQTKAESAQTGPKTAETSAESAQTWYESELTRAEAEALLASFITDAIRSDARRNMIAILECLSKHPEKSAASIAKEIGLSQSATQKIMGTLQKAGLLRREGPDFGGHWDIANRCF
ncbi:MAG: ATP-binding protein [Kiritimatiellia bacterium]